ncbi:S1C family serine protease [Hyphomonas sp.]|uniref:S1C family serine protease n=1 Tax=Hyphomonas sp. TaxID=87 RepID=UPI00391C9BD1
MTSGYFRPVLMAALAVFLTVSMTGAPVSASTPQPPDFGNDSGDFVNDGECDDPRFAGEGATTAGSPGTDASDCRALWTAGAIVLRAELNAGAPAPDFGDDSGDFVNDGDCDDSRFEGYRTTTAGQPATDASDCRKLWQDGLISLRRSLNEGMPRPDFGDDSGEYTNDGECDDPRFEGEGTTTAGEPGTDATDCAALWDAGLIAPRRPLNKGLEAPDFGDDSGRFTEDGECDDPRFQGPGASSVGEPGTDASDCAAAWAAGTITIDPDFDPEAAARAREVIVAGGIDFGDNTSTWANDGECDDPRFEGPGTSGLSQLRTDASDCLAAWEAGKAVLRAPVNAGLPLPDFGDDSGSFVNDGECDDPRFEGSATTTAGQPGTDASDCRFLWDLGLIKPRTRLNDGQVAPDFGDDSGQYARDGECDDTRFTGPGTSGVGEPGTDATDCAAAWELGTIQLDSEVGIGLPGRRMSTGSGFAISAAGHVLTNAHVVEGCAALRSPMFGELTLIATHEDYDLALLKASSPTATFASISSAPSPRLGESIVVAGFPQTDFFGKQSVTITTGTVSSRTGWGDNPNEFQMSAPIHKGNSGGPVFNMKAEIVGVSSNGVNEMVMLERAQELPQNINFAVSLRAINEFVATHKVPVTRSSTVNVESLADVAEFAEGLTGFIECISAPVAPLSAEDLARRPPISSIDFGRDSGEWTDDGECDDRRFTGPGGSSFGDIGTDASDCRRAWLAGTIMLAPDFDPALGAPALAIVTYEGIEFGDNSGRWADDGECDDPRFQGRGASDVGRIGTDGNDCLAAWKAGTVTLRPSMNEGQPRPDFGDDSGQYVLDGECDDPRFEGQFTTTLGEARTDASDCRSLWDAGLITLR